MIKRTLYFGNPAYLSTKLEQLVIRRDDQPKITVPVEDIGAVILDHPAVTVSQALLARLLDANVAVVTADERHMQHSVYLRHCGSSEISEAHTRRVKGFLPPKGQVSILRITDKQFGMIENFVGKQTAPPIREPQQLEMF